MSALKIFSKRKLTALLFIVSLLLCNIASASHLAGGYLTYTHITGNDFKVSLHAFYDCFYTGPSDSASLCIQSTSLNYSSTQTLHFDTTNTFPYHPCLGTVSSCLQGGSIWGVSENILSAIVNLPGAATDWRFSVLLCCRNAILGNVDPNSNLTPSVYYYANLNNVLAPNNSSPEFKNNLMPLFCLGVQTINDFGCTDINGDSLVYSLDSIFTKTTCNLGSDATFAYLTPFNYINFFNSSTPISLDPNIGELSFTPASISTASYSIKIDEYKNGVIVGTIKREEELIVTASNVGINDIDVQENIFDIFPNPAKRILHFSSKNISYISIYNFLGEILLTKNISSDSDQSHNIDIKMLPSGIYFIRSNKAVRKFVVE